MNININLSATTIDQLSKAIKGISEMYKEIKKDCPDIQINIEATIT